MKKIFSLTVLSFCFIAKAIAQDDLLADLQKEDAAKPKQNITSATFKSTRIINMQSVEMTGVGNLQFMISHKFGYIWDDTKGSQNFSNLFGLNSGYANAYLSFDYSPKWWLNIGAALANQGVYEGWAKFKILRQQTGIKDVPVSVVWVSLFRADATAGPSPDDLAWNRFSFLNQLLVARKFNENLSLQLNGSLIHNNYVPYGYKNTNNVFNVGLSGRYKIAAKKAITFEYTHQINGWKYQTDESGTVFNYVPDLIAIGYDWDTGGHIFQFYVSNTTESSNVKQLSTNMGNWKKGNFALGFTINRSYSVKKVVKADAH
ncbi:MAG: hypothetical protein J0I09_00345 [Sphingobacteriia bacterium]|nr:hypothetical protein [Sphingobacteriia bacterium]